MSDMINRLSEISQDAGANAGASLSARASIDSMEAKILRGVRRRRQRIGAAAAMAVLVAGTGAIVAPRLLNDVDLPTPPAAEPEIIGTTDSLTVFSDGSMSVVTSRGSIVDIPAAEPANHVPFAVVSGDQLCRPVDLKNFPLGFTYVDDDYSTLLMFGRPQAVHDDGSLQFLAQGVATDASASKDWPPAFAIQIEADAAVGSHLALRFSSQIVAEDPTGIHGQVTVAYQSMLDAQPTTIIQGDVNAGLAVALSQSRNLGARNTGHCFLDKPERLPTIHAHYLTRYVVVDVFLTDHDGNATLLGTHRSWSVIEGDQ